MNQTNDQYVSYPMVAQGEREKFEQNFPDLRIHGLKVVTFFMMLFSCKGISELGELGELARFWGRKPSR